MEEARSSRPILLLVDDDDVFRDVVADALESAGFAVLQAPDGKQALQTFERNPGIALILTDLHMPAMDGIELLRRVRASSELPVVLATGNDEVAESRSAREIGASGILPKPYETDELLEVVRTFLGRRTA